VRLRGQSQCRRRHHRLQLRRRRRRRLGGEVPLLSSCCLSDKAKGKNKNRAERIPAVPLSPPTLHSLETRPVAIHSAPLGQSQIQPRFILKNPPTETRKKGKIPHLFLHFQFLLSPRRLKTSTMPHSDLFSSSIPSSLPRILLKLISLFYVSRLDIELLYT
jgi:hypothetical protein